MVYLNIWYNNIIRFDLIYKINIINSYSIPCISRIVLSMSNELTKDNHFDVLYSITILLLITGHKPIVNKSHKSLNLSKSQKSFYIFMRKTLRKKLAFDSFSFVILFISRNLKASRLSLLNKASCFCILLNSLAIFPQLKKQFDNSLSISLMFSVCFNLLDFNILHLMISSFHINYQHNIE